jgi:hypothetical protein
MISGRTTLIARIGYPTETFKAPLIYNPYFEKAGIDCVVVHWKRCSSIATVEWHAPPQGPGRLGSAGSPFFSILPP